MAAHTLGAAGEMNLTPKDPTQRASLVNQTTNPGCTQMSTKWRAGRNKTTNTYAIEIGIHERLVRTASEHAATVKPSYQPPRQTLASAPLVPFDGALRSFRTGNVAGVAAASIHSGLMLPATMMRRHFSMAVSI